MIKDTNHCLGLDVATGPDVNGRLEDGKVKSRSWDYGVEYDRGGSAKSYHKCQTWYVTLVTIYAKENDITQCKTTKQKFDTKTAAQILYY